MKSYNKIVLLGYLASSPETTQTKNGKTLTRFALATNDSYMLNNKKIEETDFHRVVTWEHLAMICQKHLTKGSGVLLEGKLKNKTYTTDKGEKRFSNEVIAYNINILTSPEAEKQSSLSS